MGGIEPHYPQFSYEIIRIHSSMIYSDFIEYKIVGYTKTPLLRCNPFISKVLTGNITSRGQYMNYQYFTNLQFKKLLRNFFHSITMELRDSTGEKKNLFFSVGLTRVVLWFRRISNNHF